MTNTEKPMVALGSVRKSILVRATPARAFEVFTAGVDSWWPRKHHIGGSPMKRVVFEGHVGGRCFTQQEDGSEADFGTVLAWDPPSRFVMAWQVTTDWKYEPDLARSSEVEVVFTPVGADQTRVDVEHAHFERYGPAGATMRDAVDTPSGWTESLRRFAEVADARTAPQGSTVMPNHEAGSTR